MRNGKTRQNTAHFFRIPAADGTLTRVLHFLHMELTAGEEQLEKILGEMAMKDLG
jgi:hypothetical protein